MVDALEWGESFIIYKRDARFRARYIGGEFVFDTERISGSHKDDGLLSQGCAVNTPRGQVFLTDGKDIRIHQGGESTSIGGGRVSEWLARNINATYEGLSFLEVNPAKTEVRVCIPTTGNTLPNKALLWNWIDDTWGDADIANATAAASGAFPTSISTNPCMLLATSAPAIGLVDSGSTYFGGAYTSSLERTGMSFGDTAFKMISGSMPYFDATAAGWTASVYHGSSATQDSSTTYSSAATYTHGTTARVQAFSASGRYLAWKMTTTAAYPVTLRSIDFHLTKQGEW